MKSSTQHPVPETDPTHGGASTVNGSGWARIIMKSGVFSSFLLSSIFTILSLALPTGAPICSIDETRIQSGHGKASDQSLGYSLASKKVSSTQFEITINSSTVGEFKGLLMYVIGANGNMHYGSFQKPNDNFKFQTSICKDAGISGRSDSTITHANPSSKALSGLAFVWNLNADDQISNAPFRVQAVVSNGQNPWQVVQEIQLDIQSTASSTISSQAVSSFESSIGCTTSLKPQPITKTFKCRKIYILDLGY